MKSRRRTNKTPQNKQERTVNMETTVLKDRQGVQPSKDNFAEKKQNLLDETQKYMYQQSSKFSSVSRSLILGIIGTIWVLTYTEGKLRVPNNWLLYGLIGGLLFLLVDVIHYFWDSMSYQRELYRLDKYKSQDELNENHENIMDYINKRSNSFLVAKFFILIISSGLFTYGLYLKITLN